MNKTKRHVLFLILGLVACLFIRNTMVSLSAERHAEKVYAFIKEANPYGINLLNEKISLPKSYVNYFVLAEWNLKEEMLYIRFEKEQKPKVIKKLSFKINPRSKKSCQIGGNLSFD